jgi:hypothetical protein
MAISGEKEGYPKTIPETAGKTPDGDFPSGKLDEDKVRTGDDRIRFATIRFVLESAMLQIASPLSLMVFSPIP